MGIRTGIPLLTVTQWSVAAPLAEWEVLSACSDHDPELWFSNKPADRRRARQVCLQECPVLEECRGLADTLGDALRIGTWGGRTRTLRGEWVGDD